MVFSLDREIGGHYLERNVAPHIEPHVVAATQMRHAAHHFKTDAIEEDECPNCGTAGKQDLQQFVPQHDYIAPLQSIQFIEPAAFLEGKVTDLIQLRLGAQNFPAASGEFADLVQIAAGNDGAGIADICGLPDIEVVLIGEQIRTGRAHVA